MRQTITATGLPRHNGGVDASAAASRPVARAAVNQPSARVERHSLRYGRRRHGVGQSRCAAALQRRVAACIDRHDARRVRRCCEDCRTAGNGAAHDGVEAHQQQESHREQQTLQHPAHLSGRQVARWPGRFVGCVETPCMARGERLAVRTVRRCHKRSRIHIALRKIGEVGWEPPPPIAAASVGVHGGHRRRTTGRSAASSTTVVPQAGGLS